jgi:hypothetical protein
MESKQASSKGSQTQASAQVKEQAKDAEKLGQMSDAIDLLSSRMFNIENMLLTLVRACFVCNKDRSNKSVGSLCQVCLGTGYVRIKP